MKWKAMLAHVLKQHTTGHGMPIVSKKTLTTLIAHGETAEA